MGIQNYYSAATQITINLNELNSYLRKTLYNRLKNLRKEANFQDMTKTLQKRYKGYKPQYYKIQTWCLSLSMPNGIKQVFVSRKISCNYTAKGREKIHKNLKAINKSVLSLCHEKLYSKSDN